MTDELKRLLCQFEYPQVVSIACKEVYGQHMHFAVPGMVKDAVKDGLLQVLDCDGPLTDSKGIYSRDLMLTDKGREACGLQRAVVETVKKKPAKAVAKSLFD